jgi:hypothetical protein
VTPSLPRNLQDLIRVIISCRPSIRDEISRDSDLYVEDTTAIPGAHEQKDLVNTAYGTDGEVNTIVKKGNS